MSASNLRPIYDGVNDPVTGWGGSSTVGIPAAPEPAPGTVPPRNRSRGLSRLHPYALGEGISLPRSPRPRMTWSGLNIPGAWESTRRRLRRVRRGVVVAVILARRTPVFLLLFIAGCATVPGAPAGFRAGAAAVDITPPVGWRKAGGYDEVISSGIHDPLYAKAVVFEQEQ